jgi:Flp pilus assembly pilin Flp
MSELRRLIEEETAQTTAEYALVILGAAAVAGALIAWAMNLREQQWARFSASAAISICAAAYSDSGTMVVLPSIHSTSFESLKYIW